ncbi:hypothetical protein HMPREF0373_02897 [Eubacterium ramulus ATCC 29099]|uniref:Uncharacterized protein n=1 Tax=Eubacterium ramulus ATCC 29099 TaxID=1256908 RepID=U2QM53_EUBRA|nr:hypothetical protein HMPREF0373_02897 [Eubacterium ramulus ATCC 29099]
MTKPIEYINITKNKYKIYTICIKNKREKVLLITVVYQCMNAERIITKLHGRMTFTNWILEQGTLIM